jgi:hypothetical protein
LDLAVRRRAFTRALRAGEALASTPVADHLAQLSDEHSTDRD